MMKRLLILFMLVASPVMACESYEECIKTVNKMDSSDYAKKVVYVPGNFHWEYRDHMKLEAISYKLDEISKKLDENNDVIIMPLPDGTMGIVKGRKIGEAK